MSKKVYTVYAIFNMDDGHDFMPIGVYADKGVAVESLNKYMKDHDDSELLVLDEYHISRDSFTVYNDYYTRSYNVQVMNYTE